MATTTYRWSKLSDIIISDAEDVEGPAIASNAAGTRYFSAWSTVLGADDVWGRFIDSSGVPATGIFPVHTSTPSDQNQVSLAGLADGRFVATYSDFFAAPTGDIRARLFNADGSPANVLNVTTGGGPDTFSDVAALADGGFAVAWSRPTGGNPDVYMSVFNADGSVRHAFDAVNVNLNTAYSPSIAGLAGGGFVVAWEESNGALDEVRFRRFAADGTALDGTDNAGRLIDSSGLNVDIQVAALPDGGFVVAYADSSWGNQSDITAHVFNADGSARGGFLHVNSAVNGGLVGGNQHSPTLAVMPNGYFVVGWVGDSAEFEQVEFVQAYDAAGNALGANTVIAKNVNANSELAALSGGTIANVFSDAVSIHASQIAFERVITGNGGDETINGVGDAIREVILGGGGNDILNGGGGNDYLDGDSGDDTAVFSQTLDKYTLQNVESDIHVSGPDGFDRLDSIEHLQFADGTIDVVDDGNALFDTLYYLSRNPDVFHAGVNALDHFNTYGWHEGRDPNGYFDTSGYLGVNKDVAAAGINPLDHYHSNGWHEGRDPSAAFDTTLYLIRNPDVAAAGIDPLEHFLQYGMAEGRAAYAAVGSDIAGGFDAQYYLFMNPDVAAAGVDALSHFNTFGWHEGRNPNGYFNTAGYLSHYSDVAAAGMNPLDHYIAYGWQEGRDPSAGFDTQGYLAANPDVAAAGMNPLDHYLQYGIYEGRAVVNDGMWG